MEIKEIFIWIRQREKRLDSTELEFDNNWKLRYTKDAAHPIYVSGPAWPTPFSLGRIEAAAPLCAPVLWERIFLSFYPLPLPGKSTFRSRRSYSSTTRGISRS